MGPELGENHQISIAFSSDDDDHPASGLERKWIAAIAIAGSNWWVMGRAGVQRRPVPRLVQRGTLDSSRSRQVHDHVQVGGSRTFQSPLNMFYIILYYIILHFITFYYVILY